MAYWNRLLLLRSTDLLQYQDHRFHHTDKWISILTIFHMETVTRFIKLPYIRVRNPREILTNFKRHLTVSLWQHQFDSGLILQGPVTVLLFITRYCIYLVNRPISQITRRIWQISCNAPFCNRNVHTWQSLIHIRFFLFVLSKFWGNASRLN